ncbi:MAG TPA: sensor domain-containing protein [Gaiellaceae bacterium]|nr:sensor domain-containing protein [Gaiellaceae bacterium]
MIITAPVHPLFRARTYRELLFLAIGIPFAALVFALFVAGWTSIGLLVVTPLIVPVLLGYRGLVGVLSRWDAALARSLLGVSADPPAWSEGRGFWGRAKAVLGDSTFWRQQLYLLLRMVVGFGLGIGELSLIGGSFAWITQPIWYRWAENGFGSWRVDTLGRALLFVPAGLVGLVVAGWLARGLGALSAWQVRALLRPRPAPASPARLRDVRRRALRIHGGISLGLFLLVTVIWAATTRAYFWPEWVALPLGLVFAWHGIVELALSRVAPARRALAIHGGVVAALFLFLVAVWAVTSRGVFWPGWTLVGLASAVVVHWLVERSTRQGRLARRVESLETSRRGAVEEQDASLRRIERDLHDGAQARLVALGMNLGMAEQKFRDDPVAAEQLVAEARAGVAEALRELRDLARGIHPPVLSDRGIGAAIETLADRSPLPTTVTVDLAGRPPAPVETAAYFVAAEALANAAKHSGASQVAIALREADGRLEVEIADDGAGGADESGGGLAGLRRRVEALDGTLSVESPAGGPTTIRAELPCGS